jgi:hypothetical protein
MNEKVRNEKIEVEPAESTPPMRDDRSQVPPRPSRDRAREPFPDVRSAETFFPPERREELKGTWLSVQSGFIDAPQQAVRNADGLVREILAAVSQKVEGARRNLEAQWDRGEEASTETLRLALQGYRALFDRLLSL